MEWISQDSTWKLIAGDESTFAGIVQELTEPIYRFLYRMLGNAEDAEDLTQDTFYEFHKTRHKVRPDADVRPYVYTIAKRKAISLIRWRKVRRILSPLTAENSEIIASGSPRPDHLYHDLKLEEAVQNKLNCLKPDARAAIILRFFEDLSFQEIAQVMDKPESTVKSMIYRGELELRKRLDGIIEDWRR